MLFRKGPFCIISTFTFSKYVLMLVLLLEYNFNVFLHCSIATFTKVKDLNISSTTTYKHPLSLGTPHVVTYLKGSEEKVKFPGFDVDR